MGHAEGTYVLNRQRAPGARRHGGVALEVHADRLGHVALLQMLQHLVLVLEQQPREQLDQLLALQIVDPLHGAGQQQLAPEHGVTLETVWKRG